MHSGQRIAMLLQDRPDTKVRYLITADNPVTVALVPRELLSQIRSPKQLNGNDRCIAQETKSATLECPAKTDYLLLFNEKHSTEVHIVMLATN